MAELKEVFEMVTKQTEPDQDSWRQQEQRQRRTTRNRRVGAIAVVAAMLALAALVFVVSRPKEENGVANQPSGGPSSQVNGIPPLGGQIIGLDGSPIQHIPLLGGSGFALSPDGTTIAYVSRYGGVKLVGVSGGNEATLVNGYTKTNVGDAMNHVSWSPDGTQIAYAWNGEIYVMAADGSHKQQLTHTATGKGSYYPVFSPDGSTIAYWSGSSTGEDGGPKDAQIFTIPATGGTPTRLTNDAQHNIEPAWSPDGTQIVFKHGWGLGVVNADGSGLHDISDVRMGPWAPAWSPDGTKIAFLVFDGSERAIDGGPLLQVRYVTLANRKVTRLPVRVETDLNGPQWTTDTTLLVNRYD